MKTGPWSEFENRRQPIEEASEQERRDFAITHARLFGSPDGKAWLDQMRVRKFGCSIDPNIPEAHLRFIEGQRQMIRDIDREIALGNEQIRLARKTPK